MKIGKLFTNFDFFILTSISVLFIPFFGLSLTIDPVLMPRFCVWGIMTFVLLVSFIVQLWLKPENSNYSVIRRSVLIAFLGYLLFSMISLIKAANITEGIYEILKIFLSIIYLIIVTVILQTNKKYITTFVKAITILAAILSSIGFFEYFKYFFGEPGCSITGTMAQRDLFSEALFLILPFCLYTDACFSNWWRATSIFSTILMLTLILLNQTRSVWLGIFMATCTTTIVVIILLIRKKLEYKRTFTLRWLRDIMFVLITSGITFGCLYLKSNSPKIDIAQVKSWQKTFEPVVDRAKSIYSPDDERNIPRISMWRKTLKPIRDNLFLGIGAGNWKIVLPSYSLEGLPPDMFKTTFFVRPENDYVWVLAEIGILGFAFYLAVFAIVIFYIIKIMIYASSSDDKLLSIFMFFGIVGYMVDSFFQFPKERIFHSMFLLLMMGIIITIYHQSFRQRKDISRLLKFAFTAISLFLLIFTIIIGYIRMNAEIHTKKALAAREAQNWQMVISEIDKGYSVFATLDPTSTPLQWYRGEANFLLNNIPQALEDFKKAFKNHPYHIHVLNNLATSYELLGNHNNAIRYYRQAINIHPQFEDALINLGATYYNAGRYKEAYETLLRCNPNTQNPRLEKYTESVKKKLDNGMYPK